MKFKTLFGWLLILAGLAIIISGLYSSYNIFTGKTKAPEIFKIKEKKILERDKILKKEKLEDFKIEAEKIVREQLREIFPTEFLPKLLNLICWSIFLGILIFAGSQISSLGIKLLMKG
jgi:hypothetical protein